jgi:hypothetical protein
MVQVQQATFIPSESGGEIRTSMRLGTQEVSVNWPIDGSDQEIMPLLNSLTVRVEQMTYASTPEGGEIRATMKIGDRAFVSRVAVNGDGELKSQLDRLLEEIGREVIKNLQSAFGQ